MNKQKVKIAWYGLHFGEEPPLVGPAQQGAGTIFFSGCNLHCVFCQNWQISRQDRGREHSTEELVQIMFDLQKQGAANIDLVTPTPWRREIREALIIAKGRGLSIPVAWNSNAYENAAGLKKLKGLIDIYLPDFKYGDDEAALKYSRAPKYSSVAETAIREMLAQAGGLKIENGIAQSGVIIRHLILPNNLPNTFLALEKIAAIDKKIYLSLMSQYYPVYRAAEFPEINCSVTAKEVAAAEKKKFALGLENGWTQESGTGAIFLPDFSKKNPFG